MNEPKPEDMQRAVGYRIAELHRREIHSFPELRARVEIIILEEEIPESDIEEMLHSLFSMARFGVGRREFFMLNEIYAQIDPGNAKRYEEHYLRAWG